MQSLYPDDRSKGVYEQLEAEWKNFVQLRNDASHRSLDSLEGEENLARYCDIAKKIVISISQYLHKSLLLKKYNAGKAAMLGKVTEVFKKNGAFIVALNKGVNLNVGDTVHVLCSNNCCKQVIVSIQKDNSTVSNVIATGDGYEVGLKCDDTSIKKESVLYACP